MGSGGDWVTLALIDTFTYSIQPADMQWLVPQAQRWLDAGDLSRWQRFRLQESRDVHLASRFMLRHILAQRMGCSPEAIEFDRGAHGKPYVKSPTSAWEFNLSHCQNCILLVLSEGLALGADIERGEARIALADLAQRVLSTAELAVYLGLEGPAQEAFFFRAWVLKESYVKLIGKGIWHGLTDLVTDVYAPGYPEHPSVCAHVLSAPDGFHAALAFRGDPADEVVIRQRQVHSLLEVAYAAQ